jgi:aspartyl/asparaginyl beta-hydroxylase (cupin superfamily)
MNLKDLKDYWKIMRKELDALPTNVFITDNEHEDYEDFISSGKCGWLKGGQDHVQDGCISWPFYWENRALLSNCAKCPETFKLLSQIPGISTAAFALMKGGVQLEEHVDPSCHNYRFTYHLGLKCPDGCYLHHWSVGTVKEEDGKHITLNTKYPHWAENKSKEDRVILYIEIYHPDQKM